MALSEAELDRHLEIARAAARGAASLLHAEFHREGGPRGGGSHADVDDESEELIFQTLSTHFPGEAFLGEETGVRVLGDRAPLSRPDLRWVVDPNDGTSPFLKGFRGSAVSIALLQDGDPVVGVVHAWHGMAVGGDQVSWRLGGHLWRNAVPLPARTWPARPGSHLVALVSHEADRKNSHANAVCVAPLRFQTAPSIAWRMALVAAGEAELAVSLGDPQAWDLAGGHALLKGAGGVLLNLRGEPVSYDQAGQSNAGGGIFGGAPELAPGFARRDWSSVRKRAPRNGGLDLVWPEARQERPSSAMLDRAQGCLMGQLAGDALGSRVEFQDPQTIQRNHPDGVRDMVDGGCWNTLAGQPTDDSELALALGRTLIRDVGYKAEAVFKSYQDWLASGPFDVGSATRAGLGGHPMMDSQANGALMRISPLGIFGTMRDPEQLAQWAMLDAALTHPHPICRKASAIFVRVLAATIRDALGAAEAYRLALALAREPGTDAGLLRTLMAAETAPPADFMTHAGWVLIALQNAFWQLLHSRNLEEGLVDTVGRGGDTDTNAAIAGALLGAVHGLADLPLRWRRCILSCRPMEGIPGVRHARPEWCWPVDALVLAERLLVAGGGK